MNDRSDTYPDEYSRALGMCQGNYSSGKQPTVLRQIGVLGVGGARTYAIQTFRQVERNELGRIVKSHDTIFVEIGDTEMRRFVLPPGVADVIARQRDGLGKRVRKSSAKSAAEKRKASGWKPTPPPPRKKK